MLDDDGNILMERIITEFETYQRLKVEYENSIYSEELSLHNKGNSTLLSTHAGTVDVNDLHSIREHKRKDLTK